MEFSLALMSLLEKVKEQAPHEMSNAGALLRDQFVENVSDNTLRRELKQLVRRSPNSTLLEVRSEAIRWEREGTPGVQGDVAILFQRHTVYNMGCMDSRSLVVTLQEGHLSCVN